MIEKASDLAYRDYIRQHIFSPIGMTRSDFLHLADVHEEVAECYTASVDEAGQTTWQRAIYMRPAIGSAEGGAYATAQDIGLFMQAVRDGRLLSPKLTQAFFTPQVRYYERETYDLKYGFGMLYLFDKQDNLLFYLGQGEDNGSSSKGVFFPAYEVTAVLLANQDFCTWPLVWDIYHFLRESSLENRG